MEPFFSIWFGNFYEPAYGDRAFVDESLRRIRAMGFDQVMLDSKVWQDFQDRFAGKEASPYVAMQEYMMAAIKRAGLRHSFLALYMNGDNLYPHIRFSPPVYREGITGPDGRRQRNYKYWSPLDQQLMAEHVAGLMRLYGDNHAVVREGEQERLPICSMWDPVATPSFDEEGVRAYRGYFANLGLTSEAEDPRDDWFFWRYRDDPSLTGRDVLEGSDKYRTLALNMRFKRDMLKRFFHQMKARLHGVDKRLMLIPNLSQWSLFLNIAAPALGRVGQGDLWDTANRGIDPFVLEGELDNASFTAVPVGPDGDADAYVAACQFSMIRAMNRNRDFCVGLFIGRFLANDLYRYLSPAEMIGSAVASGAKGLNVYGYCGLDDGGVLHAMDGAVRDSIGAGNRWARRAMAALGRRGKARIALLFPAAMALMEPYEVPGNRDRRLDMLGYYRAFCDWGYMVDVLHPCQLAQSLGGYAMLVMPENSSYPMDPDPEAERALRRWVEAGGVLVHGPCDAMARAATGIVGQPHPDDCVGYQGVRMLITSTRCASYPGRRMADFLSSGRSAASENALGGGRVISLGFDYGLCHAARRMPHVPADKGNQDYYPVALADRDPVRELAMSLCPPERARGPQIECALFERGEVAVNHSPYPCALPGGEWVFQYPVDGNTLMSHSAAYRLYPAD